MYATIRFLCAEFYHSSSFVFCQIDFGGIKQKKNNTKKHTKKQEKKNSCRDNIIVGSKGSFYASGENDIWNYVHVKRGDAKERKHSKQNQNNAREAANKNENTKIQQEKTEKYRRNTIIFNKKSIV